MPQLDIRPDQSLASIAVSRASASRVFYRHRLDYCCGGQTSLASACSAKGLDVDELIIELTREPVPAADERDWSAAPLADVMQHLLEAFHAPLREELPRLIEMAAKVERVHKDKPGCPLGLSRHLARMLDELEGHMQKEERILFPLIQRGQGALAQMPVHVMEQEHRDHGGNLERLRRLTNGYRAPESGCRSWRALILGCEALELDLVRHIHLENNILFPRALRS